MKYEEYTSLAHQAAKLSENGDSEGAIAIFRKIVDSDLATPDRVMMCLNIATLYNNMNHRDQTLVWHGRAVELESHYSGRHALESRAVYLAKIQSNRESLADFEKLLRHPSLNEADKIRVRKYADEVRNRLNL